jgi:histidine triad (HIT) family protein
MTEDSIFTKIIKGEVPSHKVYEDSSTIAFLPLHPLALGHVLVVPKNQVDNFYDLPPADYQALMLTVQKVAKRMKEVIGSKKIGLKIEGLDVPHTHVHVLAFDNADQFSEAEDFTEPVDHEKLAEIAGKLAF